MSVIPLIRGTSIVETKDEYDAAGGRLGEKILILNIDKSQLQANSHGESNVTYDLRVGDEYRDHRDAGKIYTGERGIELFPNSAVIIQTHEHVQVPKCRFGYIVPKVFLLQQGVSNTSSKVDPGYEGPLLVAVFNLGKTNVFLKPKQKFCTLVFHDVQGDGVQMYGKSAKRITGNTSMGLFRRMRDVIERRSGTLAVLALIGFVLLISYEAGLFHGFFVKLFDTIDRRAGTIGIVLGVISLVVICIEAGLFHKIVEMLRNTRSK